MKRLLTLLIAVCALNAMAQAPNAINYQAVARNSSNNLLVNQAIGLKISILDGSSTGTEVYSERHAVTTNQFGLFTVQIGTGTIISGTFTNVPWGSGAKFMKLEMDPTGGTSYTVISNTQIVSVPYSLYANSAGTASNLASSGTIAPNQITQGGASNDQVLAWNGTFWTPKTIIVAQNTDATIDGDGTSGAPLTIAQQGAISGNVLMWNGSAWVPNQLYTDATLIGTGDAGAPFGLSSQSANTDDVLRWNGFSWSPASTISLLSAGDGIYFNGNTINSFWKSNGSGIYNMNNGPVGIGTTNPQFLFDVHGTGPLMNTNVTGTSGWNSFAMNGSYKGYIGFWNDTNDLDFGTSGAGQRVHLVTNATPRLTVAQNGRVGIGNMSPATTLDVNGTTKTTDFQMTNGAGNNRILTSDASGNAKWNDVAKGTVAATGPILGSAGGPFPTVASTYEFFGPSATITVNGNQRVVVVTTFAIGKSAAGTSTFRLDIGYQPSGGGTIVNASGGNYIIYAPNISASSRTSYTCVGSFKPGAGTYKIGTLVYATASYFDNNDYVNGYYMIINE